jgi:hypothetical protein
MKRFFGHWRGRIVLSRDSNIGRMIAGRSGRGKRGAAPSAGAHESAESLGRQSG